MRVRAALLERLEVVCRYELDARDERLEGLAVLGRVRHGERAHGAAVEAALERDEAGASGLADHALVLAGDLERRFDCLGAAVGEEHGLQPAQARDAFRDLFGVRMAEQVARVDQAAELVAELRHHARVRVAQSRDGDAAQEIEPLAAFRVPQARAASAHEDFVGAQVGGEDVFIHGLRTPPERACRRPHRARAARSRAPQPARS
ncbi:MAG: hypothetical protein IPJ19_10190 [Planctomycetes bacterium]|nr:hypothetical protein [Planctomycetota bacterium]